MKKVLVFILALQCITALAQENVTTVGIQFKPMLNTKFIDRGGGVFTENWLEADFQATSGYSLGMVIRKGISRTISVETGISYLKRNFEVNLTDLEMSFSGATGFSFINYQVPVQALIYARLSDNLWMNASGGAGVNFFPSNAEAVFFDQVSDVNYVQLGFRTGLVNWVGFSILANYGFEFRTKKDGLFYLGASFERPLNDILLSRAALERPDGTVQRIDGLYTGSYLTIDFRYFFHEDAERKRKAPKKRN